jgi:hypothetical protein
VAALEVGDKDQVRSAMEEMSAGGGTSDKLQLFLLKGEGGTGRLSSAMQII